MQIRVGDGYCDWVFTRPGGLVDSEVVDVLAAGWSVEVDRLAYVPKGFGSHHWSVSTACGRWFATVDDLDARRRDRTDSRQETIARLAAALDTARLLHDAGLSFIVAPRRSMHGRILEPLGDRFVVALYPFVDGETYDLGPYPTRKDRLAIVDRLVEVHRSTGEVEGTVRTDDLEVPRRWELDSALSDRSPQWGPGPYGKRARQLLDRHADPLRDVLGRYDEQAERIANAAHRYVLTHGEPHRANTISAPDGIRLIDWDTALLAPPERDLWMLVDEDPTIVEHYCERSGFEIDEVALGLFRVWWDLCEVSLFVDLFRGTHDDSEDSRVAWTRLRQHLVPERWTGFG